MTNFIVGVFLTVLTFVVGEVAYILTLTENVELIGGYLVFGFFTFSPVVFYGLGFATGRPVKSNRRKFSPVGREYFPGETYER